MLSELFLPDMEKQINLAVFASGSGTNAENLIKYFASHPKIQVNHVFSNKAHAMVHKRADSLDVPSSTFSREEFYDPSFVKQLTAFDYIILAGFLWLIPSYLIQAFKNRIINIHPSLLPKYGGKGMYGAKVHEAVLAAGEKESGITIHLVNEEYDKGKILAQEKCEALASDTPASLAEKIHELEYAWFPKVVESYILAAN